MTTILIAGGGIGGLAAAIALARSGAHVIVLERHDEFAELGAGIQIAPNGFHALDQLGVGAQVRDRAVYVDELRFMDGVTGIRVQSLPLDDGYTAHFGNPYAVVHRADLYAPLLAACRASDLIDLWAGSGVAGYTQDGTGVTVELENGRRLTGDALVGADGIRSTVRAQLIGDGEPRVSGHTIYRSVIPMVEVPDDLRWNAVTLWAGPRWHFVHYPIGSGSQLNLAATRDDGAQLAVAGRPVDRSLVLGAFAGLGSTARRLLELGRAWREWVVCDRDPVQVWTDGRVVLLGDAAHPMLQYAAQGACMALEDAVLLGDLLSEPGDLADRFVVFTQRRRERTARTTLVARRLGAELYHPAGPAAAARNARLAGMSREDLYDAVRWLHGFARDPAVAGAP